MKNVQSSSSGGKPSRLSRWFGLSLSLSPSNHHSRGERVGSFAMDFLYSYVEGGANQKRFPPKLYINNNTKNLHLLKFCRKPQITTATNAQPKGFVDVFFFYGE